MIIEKTFLRSDKLKSVLKMEVKRDPDSFFSENKPPKKTNLQNNLIKTPKDYLIQVDTGR